MQRAFDSPLTQLTVHQAAGVAVIAAAAAASWPKRATLGISSPAACNQLGVHMVI
jgi:hypothetical protein